MEWYLAISHVLGILVFGSLFVFIGKPKGFSQWLQVAFLTLIWPLTILMLFLTFVYWQIEMALKGEP